jgi:hypothetical protein
MTEIIAVLVFGFLAIAGITAFGWSKLKRTWKDGVCICQPDNEGPCNKQLQCATIREINADYLERRNEFWVCFGQIVVIVVIITILAVLLILEKISSEATLPVISGLGSFTLGKGIIGARNKITFDTKPDTRPAKQEDSK